MTRPKLMIYQITLKEYRTQRRIRKNLSEDAKRATNEMFMKGCDNKCYRITGGYGFAVLEFWTEYNRKLAKNKSAQTSLFD